MAGKHAKADVDFRRITTAAGSGTSRWSNARLVTRRRSGSDEQQRVKPSYQFYPGDEERHPSIRRLSLAAFGLWRRMQNAMHWGEPYGYLTNASGEDRSSVSQIARLVGERPAVVKELLEELESENVFSRTESGVIYCRRMVRDEYKRRVRGAGGAKSLDNPNVPQPKERIPSAGPSPGPLGGSPAVAVGDGGLRFATSEERQRTAAVAPLTRAVAELPLCARQLLEQMDSEFRNTAEREMRQALDTGAKYRTGLVRATPARLEAKCRDTLAAIAQGKLRSPESKAWAFTLAKLSDSSDNATPGDQAVAQLCQDERHSDHDRTEALNWIAGRPDEHQRALRSLDSIGSPSGPIAQAAREAAYEQFAITEWRRSTSPPALSRARHR